MHFPPHPPPPHPPSALFKQKDSFLALADRLPGEVQTSVLTRRQPLTQLAVPYKCVTWLCHCILVSHLGVSPLGNFSSQAINLVMQLGNTPCSLPQLWSINTLWLFFFAYLYSLVMRTVQNTCLKLTWSLSLSAGMGRVLQEVLKDFSSALQYAQLTFLELKFHGKMSGQLSRKDNFKVML